MNAGKEKSAVPATVHCDHLIQANMGAKTDIDTATKSNSEVYDFLKSVSDKYGIGFWKPGAGIIHQVVLENYRGGPDYRHFFPDEAEMLSMPHPPKGVLGVTPGMIGCAEAAEVLKIIGEYGEVLSGKLWTINVKTMETHLISF